MLYTSLQNQQKSPTLVNAYEDKVNTADSAFIFVIIQSQSRRKSKSMVRLVRAKKMVVCGLVFARKIARMILIQNM